MGSFTVLWVRPKPFDTYKVRAPDTQMTQIWAQCMVRVVDLEVRCSQSARAAKAYAKLSQILWVSALLRTSKTETGPHPVDVRAALTVTLAVRSKPL